MTPEPVRIPCEGNIASKGIVKASLGAPSRTCTTCGKSFFGNHDTCSDCHPPIPPEAQTHVRRIQAICETMRAVSEALYTQLMESLWRMRRDLGDDRSRFNIVVAAHTELKPERAWAMAETWEIVRRNRSMREMAFRKPNEALAFVVQLIEAGCADMLNGMDDNDEVMKVMSLTPRKRTQAIRTLIEKSKAIDQDHHPADQERIASLEAERDAAVELLKVRKVITPHGGEEARRIADDMRKTEKDLADVAHRLALLPHDSARDAINSEVIALSDLIIQSAERISGTLLDDSSFEDTD